MTDTPTIRRWVYDPKDPDIRYPVWVMRKFHMVSGPGRLSSVNDGDAYPGDTICMDTESGQYWIEKPKEGREVKTKTPLK